MTGSRVTVLMAVYNDAEFVEKAVESILLQTFSDFEFVIVDDGSADGSGTIVSAVADPRVRVIRNPVNYGLTRSLNIGFAAARGEFIARQDADDVSHRTRLEKQVRFLDTHADVALVGSQVRIIGREGKPLRSRVLKPVTEDGIAWELMFGNPFVHSSIMLRTSVMRQMGGYNEQFATSQDVDLWSRVAEKARVANLAECLLDFRTHRDSVSRRNYSARNVQRVESVLSSNVKRISGSAAAADSWAAVWNSIVNREVLAPRAAALDAAHLVDMIHRGFVARRPRAASNAEVRRSHAGVLGQIACYIGETDPVRGLRVIFRAFVTHAGVATRWLPRFVGAIFNRNARVALRRGMQQ